MKTIKRYKAVENINFANTIFIFCWIAYFSTYLGRLNYSAAMTQMITDDFLSKWQGGMIGTAFFACYGIGQFFNGFIGDRISPFKMIFSGVLISALCNLLMGFSNSISIMYLIWAINGFVQSMIWSPIMRIFSQLISPERRFKACVHINSTVPAGTICTYLLSTLLISFLSWRSVFFAAFIILIFVAVLWGSYFTAKKSSLVLEKTVIEKTSTKKQKTGIMTVIVASGVLFILFPTAIHGMLKDGITTWFPTYLVENHNLKPGLSILLTTILPLFNLSGAYVANWFNNKFSRDELKTCALMFFISATSLALLLVFGSYNMYVAVILTAIATSCMFGINTVIISILPMYFGKVGLTSTMTGILNSATYIGCAISMSLFGSIVQNYSWFITIVVWAALAVGGIVTCILLAHKWKNYKNTVLVED